MHKYHMTLVSGNTKVGPIPVTTTSKDSCPSTCSFKGNGCYAEAGHLAIHWKRLSDGKSARELSLEQLVGAIKSLPYKQLWRHNQAGDLPGRANRLDSKAINSISKANKGKRGFTYTHYPIWDSESICESRNRQLVREANRAGFTVNVSCETAEQVDLAVAMGLPTVIAVPEDTPDTWHTPAGNLVKTCPAVLFDNVTCSTCGICQKQELTGPGGVKRPRHTVAFPVHGVRKAAAAKAIQGLRVIQ